MGIVCWGFVRDFPMWDAIRYLGWCVDENIVGVWVKWLRKNKDLLPDLSF